MVTQEEKEKERAAFQSERTRVPHLFLRPPMVDSSDLLKWIGIDYGEDNLPIGYLKLLPQDFVVEEVTPDGALHVVDIDSQPNSVTSEGATYYADLVKAGISTFEAKSEIAHRLGIDEKNIGYAGIKDRLAITSQRISVRGINSLEALRNISSDNFFLKNFSRGKGVSANGELKGNRFIITIRLNRTVDELEQKRILEQVEDIKEQGFWNFFHFQRFGTPRLVGHWVGLQVLKGEYESAIKTFITHQAHRELPYFAEIRGALESLWGDWQSMKEKTNLFPYHFQIERKMLSYLIGNPKDFLGALHTVPDQVKMWMYAYDCFLFNRRLSEYIKEGEVPGTLPFLNSFNKYDWEPYLEYAKADGLTLPTNSHRDFPFVRIESRRCSTLQSIDIHNVVFKDKMAVLAFTLPKGSYATTFLMHFFSLASGLPVVEGISEERIDSKEVVGLGSLGAVLERFKKVLDRRESDVAGED